MLVTHIIPTAFNYFDDIKKNAFKIVEELPKYGVNCKVLTLQYNQPTKKQKAIISDTKTGIAPSYNFSGSNSLQAGLVDLNKSDLVHIHCPLMGGAGEILKFKVANPNIPLICSYYHPVEIPDIFSLILLAYNAYYLPKLFAQADVVGVFNQTFKKYKFRKLDKKKMVDLNVDNSDEIALNLPLTNNLNRLKYNNQLTTKLSLSKLLWIYQNLI